MKIETVNCVEQKANSGHISVLVSRILIQGKLSTTKCGKF